MNTSTAGPLTKDILRKLDLGKAVAEYDDSLEKYFVENEAFHALITGKHDIIAGDKGTGKTAVYRILQKRYRSIPELSGIEVLAGFNPVGNPIFQRLVQQQVLTEGQYISVWKAYFFSLVGNWILEIVGKDHSAKFTQLERVLTESGLRSKDDKPDTVFGRIVNTIQRVFSPKSAEVELTFSETGIPIVKPKVTFDDAHATQSTGTEEIRHEEALGLLDECLEEIDYTVWIALDRLDEAFQGFPAVEVPALRALLRCYLDLQAFERFRLKLFVRRDLFRKIIAGGFVNLSHINATKMEIIWDDADLLNLLARRIRDNAEFITAANATGLNDEQLFYRLFPAKVDQAKRKPTTLRWVMGRIKDGNNVKPPRNLIDLANLAREEQIRADTRIPRNFVSDVPLITSDVIRKAQERLSAQRVEDTLLAEAGTELASLINRFRRAKAEQNMDTLATTLNLQGEALDDAVQRLVEVGFLEKLPASWKVPMLYRDGLEVTQGKAFTSDQPSDVDDDEA